MSKHPHEDDGPELKPPAGTRRYAVAYVSLLVLLPVVGLAAATALGWVSFDLTFTATVSIGWLIEYGLAALAGLFLLFTAAQVVKAIGVGFTRSIVSFVARQADNYQLQERVSEEVNEDA